MATVYMLCGMVASGKSTLATRLHRQGAMVLSCDELMLHMFDHCLGAEQRAMESRALRFLEEQAAALWELGIDSVLDHGFWYWADREAARAFFSERGIPVVLYHVSASEENRRDRLARRNEGLRRSPRREYIVEDAMRRRFDEWLEPPLPKEEAVFIPMEEQGETNIT